MKVVIIGGVATGPKVAARLRRLRPDADITIVEQGDMISYGACGLPLYLGNLVPDMMELMTTSSGSVRDPDYFYHTKQVKVLNNTRAEAIDRERKIVTIRDLPRNQTQSLPYDYLVLATGASPVVPLLPGKDLPQVFTLHHPSDAQALRQLVNSRKIKQLTIIGAGLIGMEAADALNGPRLKVTLCEAQSQVLPKLLDADMAALVEERARSRGVEILLSCQVNSLKAGEDGVVAGVDTAGGYIETDAVVLAVGMRPNVELALNAGLERGVAGALKVNKRLQTGDPSIYAGGDCVESYDLISGQPAYCPLASTANKQGRVIADNIAGKTAEFPGVAKTSVLQCFDYNIGRTGLGQQEAAQNGYDAGSVVISGYDATHYHPMHDQVKLKLVADKSSRRILGAQVVGPGEGIKRLDVLITAMKYGARLEDIAHLDLGYAPVFSTAIDLAAHAANALQNKIDGLVRSISRTELLTWQAENKPFLLVDVRALGEVEAKPAPCGNRKEIPLNELHERWEELPKETALVTVCELGIRGYEAACILRGKGFPNVYYLEGGLSVLDA